MNGIYVPMKNIMFIYHFFKVFGIVIPIVLNKLLKRILLKTSKYLPKSEKYNRLVCFLIAFICTFSIEVLKLIERKSLKWKE